MTSDAEAVRTVTADEHERTSLFATLVSLRVCGFSVGALIGALGLVVDHDSGWLWNVLVGFIAVTQASSACLFWRIRHAHDAWVLSSDQPVVAPPRYRDVFRQGTFMAFVGGVVVIAVTTLGLHTVLAIYLLSLRLPTWLGSG